MELLMSVSHVFIGAMFALAGTLKLANRSAFSITVGRLLPVTPGVARAISLVVILSELVVGAALLTGVASFAASIIAAMLLVAFAVVLGVNLAAGRTDESCGCLGGRTVIRWSHIVRNLGGALVAIGPVTSQPVAIVVLGMGLILATGWPAALRVPSLVRRA